MKEDFAEYLTRTLVSNGVQLQNSMQGLSDSYLTALKRMDGVLTGLTKIDSKCNAIANELMALRKESAKENRKLNARLSSHSKTGHKRAKPNKRNPV